MGGGKAVRSAVCVGYINRAGGVGWALMVGQREDGGGGLYTWMGLWGRCVWGCVGVDCDIVKD